MLWPSIAPPPRVRERLCLVFLGLGFLLRFPVKFLLQPPFLLDYSVYRFAAEVARSHSGGLLYQAVYNQGMFFRYSPIWALLWLPLLGYLPPHAGAVLWSACGVAWLVATLWMTGRILRLAGLEPPWWLSLAAVGILSRLLIEEFSNGQANLWWGGLTVLFVWLALAKRPTAAALALALSIMLKLPSLIFIPYLLLSRRGPLAWRTLAWLAAGLLLGAWGIDPSQPPLRTLAEWMRVNGATAPEQAFRIGDQSLLALFGRVFSADGYGLNIAALPRGALIAMSGLTSAALFAAVIWDRGARRLPPSTRLAFDSALLMILMVLASPAGWAPTYNVLLCPLLIALAALAARRRARAADPLALAAAVAVIALSVLTHSTAWKLLRLHYWKGESYLSQVFMIVPLLALCLAALLWRLRRLEALRPLCGRRASGDTSDSCPTGSGPPSTPRAIPAPHLEIPA